MDYIQHQLLKKYNEINNIEHDENIENHESIALSNYEINNILNDKTKILTYKALPQFNDINQILEPYKNFIMLYMSRPNYGHWICVIKHPDRIEFFDPYGGKNTPDEELNMINDEVKEITNQNYPYLSQLLYDSNYPIEYNNYKFQEHKKGINTCGRHCIVRVLFKKLLLDDYHDLMTHLCNKLNMNYDQLVTYITVNINHLQFILNFH